MRSIISAASSASVVLSFAVGTSGGIIRGDHPMHTWKFEYLVDTFTEFIMWNRMRGSLLDHPFWLRST